MKILDHIGFMLTLPNRDIFNIIFSILLAIAISVIISQVYKYTHQGLSYELTFMATLVSLAPIVSIVMLFIRGDLVLSLGLIGSLSIVRFRTPIKDTRDMVFIFWIIAVGLGCGTYNWTVVIISTIIITILLFILHFLRYGQTYDIDYVLVVAGEMSSKSKEINEILEKHTKDLKIRSKETENEYWEIIYEIRFDKKSIEITDEIIENIKGLEGVNKVSLLAPQVALPV